MTARHILLSLLLLLPIVAFARGNDSMRGKFVVSGDQAYFPASPRGEALELWITDGTPGGTHSLADLGSGSVTAMVALKDGVACFVQDQERLTLCYANRTAAVRVSDLGNATVGIAVELNARLLFSLAYGDSVSSRHELWQSDGTAAGTILIRNLPRAVPTAVVAGDLLYFVVAPLEPWSQATLWRSDGTAAGTISLERPTRGVLARIGTSVLFDGLFDLWKNTNGTVAGSEFVAYVPATEISTAGNVAYVAAGRAVWRTDGTPSGTRLLFSLGRLEEGSVSGPVAAGDNLYYMVEGRYYYYDVKDNRSQHVDASAPIGVMAGGRFFFGRPGRGLYARNDSNTFRLSYTFQLPSGVVPFGNRVLFSTDDDGYGFEPWINDGTPAGTAMLANIRPEATLRGSVIDAETRRPVAKVSVQIRGDDVTTSVASGEDGRFIVERLPDGPYSVFLTDVPRYYAHEFLPRRVSVAAEETPDVDFLLKRGGSISGRVVDEQGRPRAGVTLLLTSATGRTYVNTDPSGTYLTPPNLEPDTQWAVQTTDFSTTLDRSASRYSSVLYEGVPCWRTCDPRRDGTKVVPKADQTVAGIDFVVRPVGKVSGRVLDSVTGEPIMTGWVLEASGGLFSGGMERISPTDATGEYVAEGRDGGTTVTASFPNAPYRMTTAGPVFVEPGTLARLDVLATPIGARVHVLATDARTGQPHPGATVTILNAAGKEVLTGLTTSKGIYQTPPTLLPGTYAVTIHDAHDFWASKTVAISVSGVEIANVDVPMQRVAVVTGIVRDAVTGQPLAGARIQLVAGDGFRVDSSSDGSGRYSMPVRAGSYVARVVKGGWYVDSLPVTATGALDETIERGFALAPACAPSITSPQTVFPAQGGTGRIAVRADCVSCTFGSSSFIHPPPSCGATGTVTFTVDLNQGAERTGWIIVPGGAIQIRQAGGRGRSVGR